MNPVKRSKKALASEQNKSILYVWEINATRSFTLIVRIVCTVNSDKEVKRSKLFWGRNTSKFRHMHRMLVLNVHFALNKVDFTIFICYFCHCTSFERPLLGAATENFLRIRDGLNLHVKKKKQIKALDCWVQTLNLRLEWGRNYSFSCHWFSYYLFQLNGLVLYHDVSAGLEKNIEHQVH